MDWGEITCSCAFGDRVILGFSNGAVSCLNSHPDTAPEDILEHFNPDFCGGLDGRSQEPIDKMRILYLPAHISQPQPNALPTAILKNETLLLTLSAGEISCHSLPDFSVREVFD